MLDASAPKLGVSSALLEPSAESLKVSSAPLDTSSKPPFPVQISFLVRLALGAAGDEGGAVSVPRASRKDPTILLPITRLPR